MPKFKSKPKSIEAWQWKGSDAVLQAIQHAEDDGRKGSVAKGESGALAVMTNHGVSWCARGEWIIKGPTGEMYPCKPDIFDATYEPVE